MTWKYITVLHRVCGPIFTTKPLQVRAFREFRVELIKFPSDYKEESTYEVVNNITGVSGTNGVQTGKNSTRYISYVEFTIATT